MIPPLPSVFFCATGVALHGQTNRQLMIKQVGGLMPGDKAFLKPIDRDSYAKVIKQVPVFAIPSLEQSDGGPYFFFFPFFELVPAV